MVDPSPGPDGAAILALGTAVPPFTDRQDTRGEWMADAFPDRPGVQRLIRTLYAYSGVERRFACTDEYMRPPQESRFSPGRAREETPSTAERMAIYQREAPPLGEAAARAALEQYGERSSTGHDEALGSITHLIVISCTGFFAPGLDFALADRLGLAPTINRTAIGFMGCSASFNGLRAAAEIVAGNAEARVLVVSVELSSLHLQPGSRRDDLVAGAIFADGAGAAIVGRPSAADGDYFQLHRFHTDIKPGTGSEMVWTIGDHGFVLDLSSRIPAHLADVAPAAVTQVTESQQPEFWTIHPGGRAIVDGLQEVFELGDDQVTSSRAVLRDYGNMSSATILFVLAHEAKTLAHRGQPTTGVAMAFGPGLTIELAQLTYVPQPVLAPRSRSHDAAPALASA